MIKNKFINLSFLIALLALVFAFTNPNKSFAATNDLISPNVSIGPGGGGTVPSCVGYKGTGIYGLSTWSAQNTTTPTFQWGYRVTALGAEKVNGEAGGYVVVSVSSAELYSAYDHANHTLAPGSLYGPHTELYNYNFHGSVTRWPLYGSSLPVKFGDIITMNFLTTGLLGSFYDGPITCEITS